MSIGINTSLSHGVPPVDQFENVGRSVGHVADGINNTAVLVRELASTSGRINGLEALRQAEVKDLDQKLRAQVPARHTFGKSLWNVFKFIGRGFMKACHAIRNGFAFAPSKRSRASFQAELEGNHENAYKREATSYVGTRTSREGAPTFTCTKAELGAAMGLRGELKMKHFTNDEIEEIREGKFKLTDITQDPNLENCWFLGPLIAFLSAKGPTAIQKLISLPPPGEIGSEDAPLMARVKLGGESYDVPLAELRGNGGSGVSASKPWVKLLETAIQMHLMNLYKLQDAAGVTDKIKVDVAFNDGFLALTTLLGTGITVDKSGKPDVDITNGLIVQDESTFDGNAIKDALNAGRPVLLLTPPSFATAIGTGLSPKHTLAVVDVVFKDGKPYLQVLDPYNRSVLVDADIIQHNGTIVMEAGENAQPDDRLSVNSHAALDGASIDSDVNNF